MIYQSNSVNLSIYCFDHYFYQTPVFFSFKTTQGVCTKRYNNITQQSVCWGVLSDRNAH